MYLIHNLVVSGDPDIYVHISDIRIFLSRFFSIIGYCQILSTVPCATQ